MQVGFNNPEAMQEFVRMQEGMRDTERKLAQCVKRAQGRSIERRRVAVTLQGLADVPDDARAYRGVGKMFVLRPLSTLKEELADSDAKHEKEIGVLNNSIQYLDKQRKDIAVAMDEILKSNAKPEE
eukprot:TRINITY_DN14071_c0_g1_i1.p3 TRINITY_DN14071_c0_g1~~TRINITY_DN14071_c0_g1_i1.p3  ORF type:complete len:126 (+),score=60.93 TRINITY_DN14071_c0_g1_i1:141-518(+)